MTRPLYFLLDSALSRENESEIPKTEPRWRCFRRRGFCVSVYTEVSRVRKRKNIIMKAGIHPAYEEIT